MKKQGEQSYMQYWINEISKSISKLHSKLWHKTLDTPTKISKEDEEIDNAIPSREKYAKQVAEIIKKYHGKDKESFIFGLSGRWGAGKTKFLKLLQKVLESNENEERFIVLTISPWKYGSEITTFLRNFLIELNNKADQEHKKGLGKIEKLWFVIKHHRFLRNLERDVSRASIEFNIVNVFLFTFILSWLIYKFLIASNTIPWEFVVSLNTNQQERVFVNAIYDLIAVLAIPVILYRLNINTTSKQVATLDQFTDYYKKILLKFNSKKIVVFVDDLDRVSPQVARTVLDSLRTFVDVPQVTFIVTGDHSVLEKHIGFQIDESKEESEQIEEGRRYLKKMFNVYWPLPIPTSQEFDIFLERELKKVETEITYIFSPYGGEASENIIQLKAWLSVYFDKNFRNIIRFLETIVFNFGLVDAQLETGDEDLKTQLLDVKNNPMLFIRMLAIQELAMPLYEKYTETPSLVTEIEEDLIGDKKHRLDQIIKEMRTAKILSLQQEKFLRKFMYEQPRFYVAGKGMVPHSIEPFIFLASSSDYSDVRGPTSEDFLEFIANQNIESISAALLNAGETKLKDMKEKLYTQLDSQKSGDIDGLVKSIQGLTQSLSQIEGTSLIQKQFLDFFSTLDLTSVMHHSQPLESRENIILSFSKWLDVLPVDTDISHYFLKLSLKDRNEIDQIEPFIKKNMNPGNFSSKLTCKWLVYQYQFDQDKALELLEPIQSKMTPDSLMEFLELKESLATEMAKQPESEKGQRIWSLVRELNDINLNNLLGDKLSEQISANRLPVSNWVAEKFDEVIMITGRQKILNALLSIVKPYFNEPTNFLAQVSNNILLVNHFLPDLWDEILSLDDASLLEILNLIKANPSLNSLLPTTGQATTIADRMIIYSKQSDSEDKESGILSILEKTDLWNSWSGLPSAIIKRLKPMSRKNVKKLLLKQTVEQIFGSWGIK